MTEDLDEIYRRASALDTSRPSEAVRRRVLEHATALASPRRAGVNRARWRPAIFGTLAAAALAGLLVIPRFFNPHPPADSAEFAAPAEVPPIAAVPPPAGAPPTAGASPVNPAPAPPSIPPPQAATRSRTMAPAGPGTTDASRKAVSRLDSAAQSGAATENTAVLGQSISPPTDQPAALRRAAETGDLRRLSEILATEVRIDAPDAGGRTALMLAASRGQTESVKVLLAHGADPNAADADGQTSLKAAIAADQPAIAAALRRAGAR